MKTRTLFGLWLLFSAVLGLTLAAAWLSEAATGFDPVAFPFGEVLEKLGRKLLPHAGVSLAGLLLVVLLALALGVGGFLLVFFATSRAHRTAPDDGAAPDDGRRRLLARTAAGLAAALVSMFAIAGAGFARAFRGFLSKDNGWQPVFSEIFQAEVPKTHSEWLSEWKGSRIRNQRELGRTGFSVSDVVLGSGPIRGEQGEAIVREALERGVNYIDTAPDYSAAGSEEAVGRAIRGRREQLFLATKFCTPRGHLPAQSPVSEYVRVVEDSLRRLGTDYVDLVHVHACNDVERLLDPNLHEAFDRLQQAGKARFLGFSSHTPNLQAVAEAAISSGRIDVMMLAYHHGLWPQLADLIARARREQNMGIVAMKTLKGAKHHGLAGFREHAAAYSQAALKWVLANSDVSCAVISFSKLQHVDEYLYASGRPLTAQDRALLREYDRLIAGNYCAPHCGACLSSCSEGLPIDDVLRYRMYFEDYGWEKEGVQRYAALAKNASVCVGCSAPCLGTCPLGIPIQQRMNEAHKLLSLG